MQVNRQPWRSLNLAAYGNQPSGSPSVSTGKRTSTSRPAAE
jgi:hypothetical protein